MTEINDINIEYISKLTIPEELREKYKLDNSLRKFIHDSRQTIQNILTGKDKRLLCIVGPCSIHNYNQALEYAHSLKQMKIKYKKSLFIVMRTYFEKPRTTVGWKGFINDPDLDNSFNINKGLDLSRKLLYNINKLGVPCGTEILDSITPQYLADLLSWGAIGARTVKSQIHRQVSSGCSFPIGFKNSCDGSIEAAKCAIISAQNSHCFRGISLTGEPSICKTKGNKYGHIILRGSYKNGPNYTRDYIKRYIEELSEIKTGIIVDCSHGNSNKNHKNQCKVIIDVAKQLIQFTDKSGVRGIMLESNLKHGMQQLTRPSSLEYGVSITDSCIDLFETNSLLNILANV